MVINNLINFFQEIGFFGLLDIFVMALLIYTLVVWSKRTRAASVLTGILIVAGIYLLARQFNLNLTAAIFEKFFAVILIALVVIFQEELRYFFERIATWSFNHKILRKDKTLLNIEEIEILARTLADLAREKIGALIVIRGRDLIVRHLSGGQECNGKLSEGLLKSIFDSHSIGHDGAVVIEGNLIARFSAHLPLSKNLKKLGNSGTRHAAALGLSELCDALCLIVSEERGTISVASNGEIRVVRDAGHLTRLLKSFYHTVNPKRESNLWEYYFKKNWRDKLIALSLALALWFVLVNGSKTAYRTLSVPVTYGELPAEWKVDTISPKEVEVTFRGVRSSFYFVRRNDIEISVPLKLESGTQRIRLRPGQLAFPKDLVLETIEPNLVEIQVREAIRTPPSPEILTK
ncbi:MAG: diadenylate cyclase [Verrucomicrobia bacterium]|nr:diadenylate cyclase [Verrucomicrobiota bacterium]MDA1069430.1 diadenylate cyclase [Verrucomicrobiota bacterium]